jgi:hypothetical protein
MYISLSYDVPHDRNNVVKVEQEPNKGEEQVHVDFVSDDGTVKVGLTQEDVCNMRLC